MSNKHLGHTARKRFGQNFLHDDYIIDKIVSAIGPKKDDNIVEIGPGLGALTEPVAELVDHFTVIELDRDLAARLRSHPFIRDKLTVVEQDALKYDFSQLHKTDKKIRVFGNLPYNISTPLMFHLFKYTEHIQDMHFMLQHEVVKRLCATSGDKLYGRLSVMAQYYCSAIPVVMVPPSAFKPAPKVDSAVVRLTPRTSPLYEVFSVDSLQTVVTAAFNQRRKTIRNSLKNLLDEQQITTLDINPEHRAEKLTLQEFAKLANLYTRSQSMNQAVQIEVSTKYLGKQNHPENTQMFVFSYTVNITNTGNEDVKLLSRYWLITNGDGEKVEVQGDGVIGEQPVISPNQTYTYTSASMLKTQVGTMEGFYNFESAAHNIFKAPIPMFSLAVPNALH